MSEVIEMKDESYDVKAIENGFLLKHSFRVPPEDPKDKYWDYKSKTFVFNQWSELTAWLNEHALPQPPK